MSRSLLLMVSHGWMISKVYTVPQAISRILELLVLIANGNQIMKREANPERYFLEF